MYTIDNLEAVIPLGQQGESGATSVTFDISAWVTLYPAGVYSLTYVRPGETTVYPEQAGAVATATVDDVTTLTWTPSDAVLDVAGNGTVVIHCTEDDVEKRSAMTSYYVALGHAAMGEAPDPVADWIEDATSKLAEVDPALGLAAAATLAANTAAGRADTIAGTLEGIAPKWAAVDISASGLAAGAAPTASVTQDVGGTHLTVGIPKGDKGDKGDTGNGIDNIARTSGDGSPGTTDTYTITYTDTTTSTFTVYNGQDYQQDFPLTWDEFRNHVRQGTIDRYFSVGDQFNVLKGATNLVFDIVDIGSSTRNVTANGNAPVDPNYFTHFPNAKPVTFLMHDVINGVMFDNSEANYQITTEIASGAKCNISLESDKIAAATYNFTAPSALVVGGRLRISNATTLQYYATPTSAPVNIAMVAGAADAEYISIAGSLSAQNHKQRVSYGSNKYTESAIRQWLNAGGAAGSFWTSKSNYDLAPSWHSTLAGFRNGLDADFLAAIGETTREVELNTVTDGGGHATIADKIFLPSRMEIYGSVETAGHKGLQFQAYVGLADIDRIKYDSTALSTARHWWLRSPKAAHAAFARTVYNTTGALNCSNAGSGFGAAAACVIL